MLMPQKGIDHKSGVGGGQHARRVVFIVEPLTVGNGTVLRLAKEKGSATSASGMAMTKVGIVVAILSSGAKARISGVGEKGTARATVRTGAMARLQLPGRVCRT